MVGSSLAPAADTPPVASSDQPAAQPASIRIRGLGWWKNRELRQTLHLLEPEGAQAARLDAPFVEDAVVLLQSSLERDGYLRSSGTVQLRDGANLLGDFAWAAGEVPELPRTLAADAAFFELTPGVRYTFEQLDFTGLATIGQGDARAYFIEEGFVFGGGSTHRFTPAILQRGIRSLREHLVRLGFADATVAVASEERDDATGHVRVVVAVDEGRPHRVGSVGMPVTVPDDTAVELQKLCTAAAGAIYSPLWQQDFVQAARNICYTHGYADAEVRLASVDNSTTDGDAVRRDFRLEVEAGRQIHVGTIGFVGGEGTRESILRRAITTHPGDLFDRSHVEQDRVKLGALGAFSSVQAKVAEATPDLSADAATLEREGIWDLTYHLRPGKRLEVSVLAGYGSYEQLRGGIEVVRSNLFERAHRDRLLLVYSQKAASGDYLYTIPQIFGTAADASARLFGLTREEVSFDRKEFGASLGARRHITWLGADASLRYQYELVRATATSAVVDATMPTDSNVAALTLDLTRDRLDNPITPHRGYTVALTFETATTALGGEVDYQRVDLRAAWHRPVGDQKYIHLGFRHGFVWALSGSSADQVPLAKRYFPGGEGTVRGYREGRAAPRGTDGTIIGAEVSTVVNVEFEQGLAKNLSAVVFVDAGLTAAALGDFPGDETRVSVGLGLRFNTVIGPARLEYGHNIVRETGDAVGALHFALGFPF